MPGIKFLCKRYSKNVSGSGEKQMKKLTKCPLMLACLFILRQHFDFCSAVFADIDAAFMTAEMSEIDFIQD